MHIVKFTAHHQRRSHANVDVHVLALAPALRGAHVHWLIAASLLADVSAASMSDIVERLSPLITDCSLAVKMCPATEIIDTGVLV